MSGSQRVFLFTRFGLDMGRRRRRLALPDQPDHSGHPRRTRLLAGILAAFGGRAGHGAPVRELKSLGGYHVPWC